MTSYNQKHLFSISFYANRCLQAIHTAAVAQNISEGVVLD